MIFMFTYSEQLYHVGEADVRASHRDYCNHYGDVHWDWSLSSS